MNLVHFLSHSTANIGAIGALVGGTAAAAKNIKDYNAGIIDKQEAAVDTGKETVGAAVATAAGAAAAGVVGSSVLVSVFAVITVGTGTKYLWDKGVEQIEDRFIEKDELEEELLEEELQAEVA